MLGGTSFIVKKKLETILALRLTIYNGCEYVTSRMKEYLSSLGIVNELFASYTPEHKGIVERERERERERKREREREREQY